MGDHIVTSPSGQQFKVTAPDSATPDQILSYAQQQGASFQLPKTETDTTVEIGRGLATGLRQGAENLVGLPGDVESAIGSGVNAVASDLGGKTAEMPQHLPTSKDIGKLTTKYVGDYYQPQTPEGKLGRAAGEGIAGSVVGPGGMFSKLTMGALSGVGSELAGQQLEGSPYEIPARIGGGIVGGGASMLTGKGIEAGRNIVAAKSAAGEIKQILGVPQMKASSVNRVAKSFGDDAATPQGAKSVQDALGHEETMVMDLGRQLQGRAEQMALHPGKAQNTVLDAVEGRTGQFGSEAARRAKETLDQHLGPSQDVVALKNKVHDIIEQHATPAYEKVMAKHPVLEVPFEISGRPAVASAMKNAEMLARNYGENVGGNGVTALPSLKYWDYVKKDMDRRINGMIRTGVDDISSAEKADLGGLLNAKGALVGYLDKVTNGEYANARKIASTKPELDDALELGRSIFNSKLLPEEVSAHIADLSLPAQAMAQVGARREIERAIGQVRNEGAKARSFLDTNNNLQKIESLFGPDAAKAIEARVAAENHFQNTTETVARNSRTAVRQELAKDTANPGFGDYHTTLTGIATAPVKSGLAYALEHGMENTRSGISDILTAKGKDIPLVVEQLLKYNAKKESNAMTPGGQQVQALIRSLIAERASR